MPKFEYKWYGSYAEGQRQDLLFKANELGKEGWEMISFIEFPSGCLTAYFKRQLPGIPD